MIFSHERSNGFVGEAVFSDTTRQFVTPCEPEIYDTVTLRIRIGKNNGERVWVLTDDETVLLHSVKQDEYFEWFEGKVDLSDTQLHYLFRIEYQGKYWFYDRMGLAEEPRENCCFRITPGFHTPDWAKGAVMYQIFVDRFCNGDPSNDVQNNEYFYLGQPSQRVADWHSYPKAMDVQSFYGGDLKGILKRLDYLEELGVEVLYLNPIFVSPSNHKYDIQDYDYIDPHYGMIVKDEWEGLPAGDTCNRHSRQYVTRVTSLENLEASNEYFIHFVEEVHKRGMKVILDGVFNHCGSFNKWLDAEEIYGDAEGFSKGAYATEESPYVSFFDFHEHKWPNNDSYDGWWGHATLPKLNYEASPKLYNYIMRIARKWVSPPYNADGWRLDVAADLGHSPEFNHKFWKEFRANVKAANPGAIILAEHYGDASAWLQGDQWDSVMNYDAFMEPVTWFLTGMQKHSDEYRPEMEGNEQAFLYAMQQYMARFQTPSLFVAMNELSNHDHSRFLTRTNRKVGRTATLGPEKANEGVDVAVMRQAVLMQMTWPGAPTVYYGDEAGLCGWTDPDNRRTYPWGKENRGLISYHKELIRIHKSYQALRTGSLMLLLAEPNVLVYARFDGQDALITLIHTGAEEQTVSVPVWMLGLEKNRAFVRLVHTDAFGFWPDARIYYPKDGQMEITLPAKSGTLLKDFPL